MRSGLAAAIVLIVLIGVTLAGGCQWLEDPPQKAIYEPKPVPMLILVDNDGMPNSYSPDLDMLARFLYDDLKKQKVFPPLIDPDKITELEDKDPAAYSKMTLTQIGHALKATQILYVSVTEINSNVNANTTAVQESISAKVRIVDVDSGKLLWPADQQVEDGQLVTWQTPATETPHPNDTPILIRQRTEKLLALHIGEIFHSWKLEDNEDSMLWNKAGLE